jgi:hypothetical protein
VEVGVELSDEDDIRETELKKSFSEKKDCLITGCKEVR